VNHNNENKLTHFWHYRAIAKTELLCWSDKTDTERSG